MAHIILGGGISGLSTAYYLSKIPTYGIKIYESSNRVGGWINSVRTKNGTLFELGPRTLRSEGNHSENTLMLSEEIGLMPSTISLPHSSPVAKNKLIYCFDQLVCLPNSLISLIRIKPPYIRPLLAAAWKDYTTEKKTLDDDSVYNFMARRFGEDYAEYPASAMVCGIFGGDSKEISVKSVMNPIFEFEQKYGSIILGAMRSKKKRPKYREELLKWSVWSFQDGLESLPAHLKKYLEVDQKAQIFLEKRCTKITFDKGKAILTINGEEEIADHAYCALPSRELARIISNNHQFLKTELSSIPFVSIAVVNLEYEDGVLTDSKAFGFLVPPNQNLPILGVVYDTSIFPQKGKSVLTVLMGGKWFEKHFGENPECDFLLKTAVDHVRKILKINKDPKDSKVTVLRNCLPQYLVGHSRKIKNIREYITKNKLPLSLIGNSYDGVGVHDAIMSAKTNVNELSQGKA